MGKIETRLATVSMRLGQNVRALFSKGICPQCSSSNVRLSRRKTDIEKALSNAFWIRPLRCRDCQLRFWNWDRHKSKERVTCIIAWWANFFLLSAGF